MRSRSGTWLAGFGIGLLAGILGPSHIFVRGGIIIFLLLLGCAFATKSGRPLLMCAGAAWGFLFNPPVLPSFFPDLYVSRQGSLLPSSRLIVSVPDGREFQTKGAAQKGDEGSVRCMSRTWFFEPCRFRAHVSTPPFDRHIFQTAVRLLRRGMDENLRSLSRFERSWLEALILGDESDLSSGVREDFKRTGLYHLLVVSGFHFTVLCRILDFAVRGPFQLAYLVGLISARSWSRLACFLRIAIVGCAFLYGLLVGFQAPCQRALLGFAVTMLEPLFQGRSGQWKRMQWTVVLQTLLFPGGFASVSNFLSWGAYVFVVATLGRATGFIGKLTAIITLQVKLLILSFALIGKASLVGIFANAAIAPFFPLVFIGALLRLLSGTAPWGEALAQGQTHFVVIVRSLAGVASNGLLTATPRHQRILIGFSVVLFLLALRRIQKSLEGPRAGCYPRRSFHERRRQWKDRGKERPS